MILCLMFPCRPGIPGAGDARFDAFRKKVTQAQAQAQASRRDWPLHPSVRTLPYVGGRERGVLESELEANESVTAHAKHA